MDTINDKDTLYQEVIQDIVYDPEKGFGLGCFDMDVSMPIGDILEAYAAIIRRVRKEDVLRSENGVPADTLIPQDERAASYQAQYTGKCSDLLERYRGSSEFVRMGKDGFCDLLV